MTPTARICGAPIWPSAPQIRHAFCEWGVTCIRYLPTCQIKPLCLHENAVRSLLRQAQTTFYHQIIRCVGGELASCAGTPRWAKHGSKQINGTYAGKKMNFCLFLCWTHRGRQSTKIGHHSFSDFSDNLLHCNFALHASVWLLGKIRRAWFVWNTTSGMDDLNAREGHKKVPTQGSHTSLLDVWQKNAFLHMRKICTYVQNICL